MIKNNRFLEASNWAEYEEHIERNPARRLGAIGLPSRAAKRRVGFDIHQLNRIFRAPFYIDAAAQSSRGGRFWVPLLGLWTGMRLGECVQLRTDDVALMDGVDVILVRRDEEGDKRLKTAASTRIVPIHSELKNIGFLKYVEAMREIGEIRLFPELPKGKAGYYSDPFQKWFSRFLVKIGVKTPKTSFHSFRHCFRSALDDADISAERVRVLGGWARGGGTENMYGSGYRASALAEEIKKVRYDGLDLSHLHV